jgi:hypothetical protein
MTYIESLHLLNSKARDCVSQTDDADRYRNDDRPRHSDTLCESLSHTNPLQAVELMSPARKHSMLQKKRPAQACAYQDQL